MKFQLEHLLPMRKGILLYNQQHYWECHEELEDFWRDLQGNPLRFVPWVLIQTATALYHWSSQNLTGASGMIYKAKEKIAACERVATPLMETALHWKHFKHLLEKIPDPPTLNDFNDLATFKFPHPDLWPK